MKAKAKPEPVVEPEPELLITGNTGELRSEKAEKPTLFASLFGGSASSTMLPETRALDSVLEKKQAKKKFKVKPAFEPQEVDFSGYSPGTIVIDTSTKFLYLVESRSTARRYAIAVGREGLLFTGEATVGDKQEWPRWIPTLDMQKREPKHYGQYKDGMDGGPDNPLGARAIYLFQGKKDTRIRIHGTNQPQSIGIGRLEWLFPDDQRPRHRPLQAGEARHAGRRALIRLNQSAKKAGSAGLFVCTGPADRREKPDRNHCA